MPDYYNYYRRLKTIKYVFPLICFFIVTSCEKEIYKINVRGKITDATTGEPIKDTKVKLTYSTRAIMGFDTHIIGEAQSDENGNYEINFRPLKENRRYYFQVEKENYIVTESAYIEYENSVDERNFDGSFALFPQGVFELHVQNVSAYDEEDNLNCYLHFVKSGKPSILLGFFFGKNINQTVSSEIPANQYVVLDWSIRRNGIIVHHADSIFCNPFETTKFDLKY